MSRAESRVQPAVMTAVRSRVHIWSRATKLAAAWLLGGLALLGGPIIATAAAGPRTAPAQPEPRVVREEVGRRTEMSRTFLLSDGSHQTRIFLAPVNFKGAQGDWHPIDTKLRSDGAGGLETTAGETAVSLPAALTDSVGVADGSGRKVSFALQGAGGAAVRPEGSSASYDGVRPGVDAEYVAVGDGVKETLMLRDASAPSEYAFSLEHSAGLVPSIQDDGSVRFAGSDGVTRFWMPAPTVQEHGADAPTTAHVSYRLSADHATLSVVVDADWLAQAKFPVAVDPSIYTDVQDGCTITNGSSASTADCNAASMAVGFDGTRVRRGVLRFKDLAKLFASSATVTEADLKLYATSMTDMTTDRLIDAGGLGKQMTTGATWNTYDGVNAWTTPGGDVSATAPAVTPLNVKPSYINGVVGHDLTALVQSWIRDPAKNNGLLLRAHDESVNNVLTFDGPTGTTERPALYVTALDRPGQERDQTYEGIGIDDRSSASVNVASGNLAVSSNDLTLPGVAGLDLNLSRTFNGQRLGDEGMTGSAWAESFNGASLRMDYSWLSHSHVLYANGGAAYRFENTDANWSTVKAPNLATPPGIDAKMVESSSDQSVTVTFNESGMKWIYGDTLDGYHQVLTQIKDVHGNHIDFSYTDPSDYRTLRSVTDSRGQVLTVNRDTTGMITGLTDSQGRHWSYGVAATHHVLGSYTDPTSKTTSYSYDTTDPINVWDKLVKITDARGNDIKFEYDGGATGDYSQVTKITRVVDGTTANDVSWSFNYSPASGTGYPCSDSTNGRTVETDPRGKLTTYCYNASGQVVQTWDALGRKRSSDYNAQGNVTSAASAEGGTANPATISYATDSTHNPTGGKEPAGETFGFTYCMTPGTNTNSCSGGIGTGLGEYKTQSSTDEQGATTNYDYNATGDLKRVNDAQSPTVASLNLDYNTSGTVTDGTLKTSTDANGNTTTYGYTSHNLTTITPPSAAISATTLSYDSENRVKTMNNGLVTATLTYDGEDRVTDISYSNGREFVLGFDANGNPISRVEKLNGTTVNTTTYTYDKLNRRITETFPGSVNNTYGYDKIGNLTSLTDASGTTTYDFDEINRLKTITSPKLGTADCVTSPTSCDSIGYSYADVATPNPYDGATASTQTATFPGGITQKLEANGSGRLKRDAIENGATNLLTQSYSYLDSPAKKALVQSMTQSGSSIANTTTTTYKYGTGSGAPTLSCTNNLGALCQVKTTTSGGTVTDEWLYTTDRAGNRTVRVHNPGPSAVTTSYAYNADNQMCWSVNGTSSATCSSTPAGATTYSYNTAGDQTTGQTYDALSRMTAIGSTALSYLTPGNQELTAVGTTGLQNALLGLMRQVPASGSAISYTRQPDGTPVAQRTASANSKQYLFGNQIGSIVATATNGGATLANVYAYDPDGTRSALAGSTSATDLGFAGGYSPAGGLIHFGARYYNPQLARWTQQDPLNQITSLQEANRYGYVGGDPVNGLDTTGDSNIRRCYTVLNVLHCILTGPNAQPLPQREAVPQRNPAPVEQKKAPSRNRRETRANGCLFGFLCLPLS